MTGRRRPGLRGRLTGLAALLALLGLLLGIPAALLAVAGNPLTVDLPSWRGLLSPDDGSLFLTVLVLVGWLAWASFALSVLVEAAATLRGRPAPHLPALHLQQRAAAGLVGAAALLFSLGGPAMASSPAAAGPVAVTQTAAACSVAVPAQATTITAAGASRAPGPASVIRVAAVAAPGGQLATYTVVDGESLWSIAEHELGDGARFAELARLNYGRPQPDGGALTSTHWIRAGWTLRLPTGGAAPAAAEHLRTVHSGDTLSGIARDEYGDPTAYTRIAQASRDIPQPGGAHLTDPDAIDVGWSLRIPGTPAGAAPGPAGPQPLPPVPPGSAAALPTAPAVPPTAPAATPTTGPSTSAPTTSAPSRTVPSPATASAVASPAGQDNRADHDADQGVPVRTAAGVGALLAAGVLTLLATRRRAQQRRRRPGRSLPLPQGASAAFERDLRANADPLSVETVDIALRGLAASCAATNQPLPVVRAARLTAGQFDLYLAEPASLPEPWTGTVDATVWSLPGDTEDLLDPDDAAHVPAPYPSLVTVGHDVEDGHVLLDLEHLGALAVSGESACTREVLAAIAVELATSRWADDLQVTLVGAYPELEDCLRTGRIRYLPAVGHLIDELRSRADRDRALLGDDGATDLQHARAAGTAPDAWTPQILLLAGPLHDQQRRQLQDLLHQLPRVAVAVVTTGEPLGEWAIQLRGDQAVLEPIGLQLRPQRITDRDYAQMLETIAFADEDDDAAVDDQPAAEPTLAELPKQAAGDEPAAAAQLAGPADLPADTTVARANGSVRIHLTPNGVAASAGAGPARLTDLTTSPPRQSDQPVTIEPVLDEAAAAPGQPTAPAPDAVATPAGSTEQACSVENVDEPDIPLEAAVDRSEDGGAGAQVAEPTDDVDLNQDLAAEVQAAARVVAGDSLSDDDPGAQDRPAPRVLVLGPPSIQGARGVLPQDSHAPRLTELAAFLALRPGSRTEMIRDEVFGAARTRPTNATVTQAASRLRRWLGDQGEYLPAAKRGFFSFGPAMTSDWNDWQALLPHGAKAASTEALQQALSLVRHRPLAGSHYPWADPDVQQLTAQIVDAAYELARRQLMEGRYQAVLQTTTKGLIVESSMERLWRLKILAAHLTGNTTVEADAINRVLQLRELLGGELEPETTQLLTELRDPTANRIDQLAAQAL